MTETQGNSILSTEAVSVDSGANVEQVSTASESVETQKSISWIDTLPEDLKGNKSLQNFKDPVDVAKSYVHLVSKLGEQNKIAPLAASEYQVPTELGDDLVNSFKNMAHKAGLSQGQAKAFMDELVLNQREESEKLSISQKQAAVDAINELKTSFGNAYDHRLLLAKRAAAELMDKDMQDVLKNSGLDSNPKVIKFFADLGVKYLEAHRVVEQDKATIHGTTPEEAQRQLDDLLSNPENRKIYFDKFDERQAGLREKVLKLQEAIQAKNGRE